MVAVVVVSFEWQQKVSLLASKAVPLRKRRPGEGAGIPWRGWRKARIESAVLVAVVLAVVEVVEVVVSVQWCMAMESQK